MKIYTKGGDDGTTALYLGDRVRKSDLHIHALGEIDELNSWLGLIATALDEAPERERLYVIQADLHVACSMIANPEGKGLSAPQLSDDAISRLEETIDEISARLATQTSFILMGGSPVAAQLFVARAVCRRAERTAVALRVSARVEPVVTRYLNRLSDLLFTMARDANRRAGRPDLPWVP